MAAHRLPERGAEGGGVERAGEMERHGDMEIGIAGLSLLQETESLLREGGRGRSPSRGTRPRRRRHD